MRQEADLRAFIQNGHGRALYGGVRRVLEIGQRVIQPPAQRAGQDQRPEAVAPARTGAPAWPVSVSSFSGIRRSTATPGATAPE